MQTQGTEFAEETNWSTGSGENKASGLCYRKTAGGLCLGYSDKGADGCHVVGSLIERKRQELLSSLKVGPRSGA